MDETNDWHERYEAARKELNEATIEWTMADAALSRANARRNRAERIVNVLFRERINCVNA